MGDYTNYIENLISELELNKKNYNFHNYKVSVIIPVYNSENYIYDCLRSIIYQSLKEIEIIVIDDGSRDLSRSIITEFSKYDSRIRFIRQEYTGRSAVRNKGLEIANGEYISFVNSKDRVSLDYFERLYEAAIKNHADVCFANAKTVHKYYEKSSITYKKEVIGETLEHKVKIANIIEKYNIWNKLYKKELIIDKKFTIGIDYEDAIWLPLVLKDANKVVTTPDATYYYRVNTNSIVKTSNSKKQTDNYNAKKEIIKFFDANNLTLSKKERKLTKKVYYLGKLPIIKIKEYMNTETYLLLGLIPVYELPNKKNKIRRNSKKNFFYFKDLDGHYIIQLLCLISIKIKHKPRFKYREATEYGLTTEKRNVKLIVSLTSFPQRISSIHKTINTILDQTVKPDEIILWLAEKQFPNKEMDLPKELLKLRNLGLTIDWCEDLRSYKKLIPTLRKYPNDIIVTADDDVYYQNDWLESLYYAYLREPNNIHTRRLCKLSFDGNNFNLTPINNPDFSKNIPTCFWNQQVGCGGVLYPPKSLYKDIYNIDLFKTLVPTHDDVYFWAMATLNGTKVALVKDYDTNVECVENTQQFGLCKQNKSDSKIGIDGNTAFARIFKQYPELEEKLKKDVI